MKPGRSGSDERRRHHHPRAGHGTRPPARRLARGGKVTADRPAASWSIGGDPLRRHLSGTSDCRHRFGFGYLIGFGFAWAIVLGQPVLRRPAACGRAPSGRSCCGAARRDVRRADVAVWLALLFLPVLAHGPARRPSGRSSPGRTRRTRARRSARTCSTTRRSYLERDQFFIIRTIAFFAIWLFFSLVLRAGLAQAGRRRQPGAKPTLAPAQVVRPDLPHPLRLHGAPSPAFDWIHEPRAELVQHHLRCVRLRRHDALGPGRHHASPSCT